MKTTKADLLSFYVITLWGLLQAYVIYHPGTVDDVVSARVTDLALFVTGGYLHRRKE